MDDKKSAKKAWDKHMIDKKTAAELVISTRQVGPIRFMHSEFSFYDHFNQLLTS